MNETMRGLALLCAALLPLGGLACGDPVGPALPELEVVAAAGGGQYGAVGQTLPERLHAVVVTKSSGTPRKDVTVRWEVISGDATFVTSAAAATDSTGSAYATVRLGSSPGEVTVRVTVVDQASATATFTAYAVDTPQLTGLSATQAAVGDTLTLTGLNFHPEAASNAVLFSGIRAVVVGASATQLQAVVPACLPTRSVGVQVMLGALASQTLSLAVSGGTQVTSLAPGAVLDLAEPTAPGCLRLSGSDGASYLAVAYSAGLTATATYAASFRGLSSLDALGVSAAAVRVPQRFSPDPDVQGGWERRLRLQEHRLVAERGSPTLPHVTEGVVQRAPTAVPSVGDERSFQVLNGDGGFDEVNAVARYVGEQAVLYVDKDAPAGGFTSADLAAFSDTFDETIYPTVAGAFGAPSDLDGNDRIVILFTPGVNRLTARGAQGGYVGGFFYGLDLLTDREGSNRAEVFYALVPDPSGEFSDPRSKAEVLDVTPAILAHEFQHMIHFNQRILVGGAESTEALWLSEGLAQMAEELVARAFLSRGNLTEAADFREGYVGRARRYLANPLAVSLLVTTGQGSLEERGAGVLHVLYLVERFGESVLGRLTSSARTGVENVRAETGLDWDALLADWWAALYLDGRGAYGSTLGYGAFGLRDLLRGANGSDALNPQEVGAQDFLDDLSFWASSARHYILRPPSGGSLVVRLGGEGGGTAPASSELRLRIVRLF